MMSGYGDSAAVELVRSWCLPFSQVTALLHNFALKKGNFFVKKFYFTK